MVVDGMDHAAVVCGWVDAEDFVRSLVTVTRDVSWQLTRQRLYCRTRVVVKAFKVVVVADE